MATRNSRLRSKLARQRRRNWFRQSRFENLEERRLLAYVPATPELGIFVEQGGAPTSNGQVTNITPNNRVNGAIESVLAHPTNPDIVYVGSINGGIWRTDNATATNPDWTPQTDDLTSLTIGAVEFDTNDSFFTNPAGTPFQTLVAGTGNFSSFGGAGGSIGSVYVTHDSGDTWVDPGSNGLAGIRISGIASKDFANTIVVSGDNGGIYRSNDGGANFTEITIEAFPGIIANRFNDLFADLSAYDRLYVSGPDGIFRSDDFGSTWNNISKSSASLQGLLNGGGINNTEMVVHPNSGRLFIGVIVGGQPAGLFYTDTGDTVSPIWREMDVPIVPLANATNITGVTNTSPITITAVGHGLQTGDLVLVNGVRDSTNSTPANGQWVAIRIDNDTVLLNQSNGTGAGTYTANTGQITKITNPSPSFKDTSIPGSQGRIHFSIGIDPNDQDIVYIGGDRQDTPFPNAIGATNFSASLFRGDIKISRDPLQIPSPQWDHLTDDSTPFDPEGGTANGSAQHADSRDMAFDANGNLLEVNDGGIFRRTSPQDNTGIWESLSGTLGVFEYHDVAYDSNSNIILAGAQDNGTQYQLNEDQQEWSLMSGGDGGDVVVDNITLAAQNQSIRYSSAQTLLGFRSTIWDANNNQISGTSRGLIVTGGAPLQPQFDTSIVLNAIDPRQLLIGARNGVYESFSQGNSITQTSTFPISGGAANPMAYGGRSAVHGDNAAVIYAGDVFGNVHVREATASTYTSNIDIGSAVLDIRMNPNEWWEAVAIDSDTVVRTTDKGTTWDDITGNLNAIGATAFRAMEYISTTIGGQLFEGLVLGTNQGVYGMTFDAVGTWFQFGSNVPNAPIYDMDYDAADDVLVLGTLGRGAWKLKDASTFLAPAISLTVNPPTVTESSAFSIYTATLSRVFNEDIVVPLRVNTNPADNGPHIATDGVDYISPVSITIPAGLLTATAQLIPLQDSLDEFDETAVIQIDDSALTNARVFGVQNATTTIVDDDPAVVNLTLDQATIGENGASATIGASIGAFSPVDIVINLQVDGANTTASGNGVDYLNPNLQITIPAGSLVSTTTLVTSVQDILDEPDETVTLSIASVSSGAIKGTTDAVTVTISDDDAPPMVTLSRTPESITESGGTATFTATLSTVSSFNVVVDLAIVTPATLGPFATGGGVDYDDPGLQITIPAGSLSGSTTLTAKPDAIDEPSEIVVVEIASVTMGTELGQQRVQTTILDENPEPTVSLAVDTLTIVEAGGVATFTVSLNTVSGKDVTVNLGLSGEALRNVDYNHSALSVTIPAGQPSATLTVTALDDSLDEENQESVGMQILTAQNAGIALTGVVSTAIVDNDNAPSVTFSRDVASIAENSGVATFTATLSEVSGRDVFVEIVTSGVAVEGIGPNDGDYFIPPPKNITIPAGQLTGFTRVIAVQDNRHEGDEEVIVSVNGVQTGSVIPRDVVTTGPLSDSILIIDDDPIPSVSLSGGATAITEASGVTTFTATLSRPSVDPITVDINFTGTASNGTDYTASQSTLTFAPGATIATFTVTAIEDTLDEFNESVLLTLANPTNATLSSSVAASTSINDNDAAPLVSLAVDQSSVGEAGESIVYAASLSAISGLDVTVGFTLGGSATTVDDFTGFTTLITIPAGFTFASFTVITVADGIDEIDEDIIVNVSSVINGIEDGVQGVSTTIVDGDPFPEVTLAIDPDTIGEDNQSTTLTATLSQISSRDITIDLDFGGNAQLGVDYTASQFQIVIPAGSLSATVSLQSIEDAIDELHEQIEVTIVSVDFATEATTQLVTTTITDNDSAPTVTLTSNPFSITEASGQAFFTATLSAVSGLDVTVGLSLGGTATEGADYTTSGNSIVIPAGTLSNSITVTAIDDSLDEVDETVIRDISSLSNATLLSSPPASTLIVDNDAPPVVTLQFQSPSVAEGDTGILVANLSAPSSRDVTVNLSLSGTATNVDDYTANNVSIVIPAGSVSGFVNIDAVDDALFEVDETIIAAISSAVNATSVAGQSDTLTILSDDAAPDVTLTSNLASIEENGTATITATLDAVSQIPVTITIGLSGDATLGTDYQASQTTLQIPAGSTSASMTVTSFDDSLDEVNEVITVSIVSLVGAATQTAQSVDVTILDNDLAPQVSLAFVPASISETNGEAELQVNLSAPSSKEITLSLAALGTATSGVDYVGMQTDVTIPAGSTSASFTLSAVGDLLDESNETVTVSIQSIVNATTGSNAAATLTILDDDLPPSVTLTIDNTVLAEAADSAIITATLSEPSGLEVVVTLGLTGTASSFDYGITGTQIVIPAGATTGTVVVTTTQDLLDEPDETILVDLSNVTGAIEQVSQQVSATIIDDDIPPTVTLVVDQATLLESSGDVATLTATLSAASGNDITIDLEVTGTAETSDVTAIPLQIVIPAGATAGTITFSPVDDSLDELDETVNIAIVSVSGASELGDQSTSTTILDDDAAPNLFLLTDLSAIDEAAGQAVLTVQLSTVSELDVLATVVLSGTALPGGVDYNATNLEVAIPAGSLSASITLDAVEDLIDELDETIVAQVQSATNAGFDPATLTTVSIVDNDLPPTVTFAIDVTDIDENGGVATYTATLSEASGLDVVITPTITATAATSDYAVSNTQIVIPAGSVTGTLTITGVDDALFEHDEQVTVSPGQVVNATTSTTADSVVNIIDNDPFPSLSLRLANTTVVEGESEDVIIELSQVAGVDIMVDLTLSGTATEIGDYTISSKSVIIPAGQKSITVSIATVNDALDEVVENVSIQASASDGVIVGSQTTAELNISDDDPAPTANVRVDNFTLNELGGQSILTVQLSQASGRDIAFNLSLAGKAVLDVDYTLPSQQLVVPAGSTTASVLISTLDDSVFEGDETLEITVSPADSDTVNFNTQKLTLNLIDNEARPTVLLESDTVTIPEADGVATITASLTGLSDRDIVVQTSILGQGDVTGEDFSASSNNIVIPAGQLSGSITITATNDSFVEQDGVIGLTVTRVTGNLQTSPDQINITIIDDDDGRLVITSDADPIVVGEDGSTAQFSVALSSAPLANVVVAISSSDSGEVTVLPRSLVFTPQNWNQPQSATVTGQPDLFEDGNIAVKISLSINESISDVGFAGLGTTVVDVVNTNLTFRNLQLIRQGDQLLVLDQGTGRVLDTRPIIDGERLKLNLGGGAKHLDIDTLGDFQNIVEIDMQTDDTINYGGGWVADQPRFIDGRYTHVLRRDNAILYVRNSTPNVNPYNPHDTNRDGVVTPSDALVIINQLTQNSGPITNPVPDEAPRTFYQDVNGDNLLSALDALQVINFINRFKSGYDASLSIADFLAANQSGQSEWTANDVTTIDEKPVSAVMGSVAKDQGSIDQAISDLFDHQKVDTDESADLSQTLVDDLLRKLV